MPAGSGINGPEGSAGYIDLSDFSSGVHDSFHSTQTDPETFEGIRDGAAQVAGTFGCYGRIGGGLFPLFKHDLEYTQDVEGFITDQGITPPLVWRAEPDAYEHMQYTLGTAMTSGWLYYPGSITPYTPEDPGDKLLILQSWLNTTNAESGCYEREYGVRVHNIYSGELGGVRTIEVFKYGRLADSAYDAEPAVTADPLSITLGFESFGQGYVTHSRAVTWGVDPESARTVPFYAIGISGVEGRVLDYAPFPYMAVIRYPGETVKSDGLDAVNWTNDFYWDQFNDVFNTIVQYRGRMDGLVSHQTRLAMGFEFFRLVGGASSFGHDGWHYSPQNEGANWGWRSKTQDNGDYFATQGTDPKYRFSQYGSLRPSPVGAYASMNANELLVIKRNGGAYIVRGDMESPQVLDMQSVTPTFEDPNIPIQTPLGLVYGSTVGVMAWGGGDTSTLLSPQLDTAFWRNRYAYRAEDNQPRGKFGFMHPWLFVPNGYLFNILTKSWWRLEDPDLVINEVEGTEATATLSVTAFPSEVNPDYPSPQPDFPFRHRSTFSTDYVDGTIATVGPSEWWYAVYHPEDDEDPPAAPDITLLPNAGGAGYETSAISDTLPTDYPFNGGWNPDSVFGYASLYIYRHPIFDVTNPLIPVPIGFFYSTYDTGSAGDRLVSWQPFDGDPEPWVNIDEDGPLDITASWITAQAEGQGLTPPCWYEVSDDGRMYAIAPYTTVAAPVIYRRYEIRTERSSYQWTSQPLARTRNRKVSFSELVLTAQGTGTVKVYVIKDGIAELAARWEIDSIDPTTVRAPVSFTVKDACVRIIVTAATEAEPASTLPAPVIHKLSIGYRENQSVGS